MALNFTYTGDLLVERDWDTESAEYYRKVLTITAPDGKPALQLDAAGGVNADDLAGHFLTYDGKTVAIGFEHPVQIFRLVHAGGATDLMMIDVHIRGAEDALLGFDTFYLTIGGDPLPTFGNAQAVYDLLASATRQYDSFTPGALLHWGSFLAIDRIEGGTAADALTGSPGDDLIFGHGGNDWITPGTGSDSIDGGAGSDMVSYIDATERVVVDLAAGTATVGSETDTLISIENVTGTIWSDLIAGDAGASRLRGMGGYDWFVGSEGNDTYEGGTGRDTVAYSAAASGVNASLLSGTGTLGQALGDSYSQIESLTGSSHKDWLVGSNDANVLRGLGGDDILFGMGGNDTMDGGAGNDWLDGGAGNDRMTGGRGNDTIDGGAGWDTAIHSGRRADYTVSTWSNGWTSVFDTRGTDGTDIVMNVEVLQFADGSLWL